MNLDVLDLLGTIAIVSSASVVIHVFTGALPIRPMQRLMVAASFGAWIGLSIALAAAGELNDAGKRLIPLVGFLFATPLLAVSAAALLLPAFRAALLAVPMPLLIALNTLRIFGGFFLLLALAGRMGGPFPHFAGWGDVITGMLAIPIAYLAARPAAGRDGAVFAWNAFGALDLAVAVALGVTSAGGSALQIFHSEAGSSAVTMLPWALIPTALVPFFLTVHAVIFAQLRARAAGKRPSGQPRPGMA